MVSASATSDAVHYPHKKYVGSGTIVKEFQTSPQILISFKFSIL